MEADEAANDDSEVVTLADLMAVLRRHRSGGRSGPERLVRSGLPGRAPDQSGVGGGIDGRVHRPPHTCALRMAQRSDRLFRDRQAQRAEQAAQFLATVGPETTSELLARSGHELAMLSDVDMDALVDRVTMERVLEKVDVNTFMGDVVTTWTPPGCCAREPAHWRRRPWIRSASLPGAATRIAGRVVRRPS